ncbi:transducin family protein / WD-40 repeat family protein [Artemisia annua]|uniref:Transducin family protein / WD-40 repeat family protein n=1 Tax=Artemisia annua TaxID=35608 RepID=A0A2U1KIS9_ARTAN|nr:transducin family protein / WD-40 repeat family protein [Artemisia annua]
MVSMGDSIPFGLNKKRRLALIEDIESFFFCPLLPLLSCLSASNILGKSTSHTGLVNRASLRPTSPKSLVASASAFESVEESDEDVYVNENENANLDSGYLHTNGNVVQNANVNGEQLPIAAAALMRSHSVLLDGKIISWPSGLRQWHEFTKLNGITIRETGVIVWCNQPSPMTELLKLSLAAEDGWLHLGHDISTHSYSWYGCYLTKKKLAEVQKVGHGCYGEGNHAAVAVPPVGLGTQSGSVEIVDVSENVVAASFAIHDSVVRSLRWLGNSRIVSFSYNELVCSFLLLLNFDKLILMPPRSWKKLCSLIQSHIEKYDTGNKVDYYVPSTLSNALCKGSFSGLLTNLTSDFIVLRGKVFEVLKNWPERSIQVIVVTAGLHFLESDSKVLAFEAARKCRISANYMPWKLQYYKGICSNKLPPPNLDEEKQTQVPIVTGQMIRLLHACGMLGKVIDYINCDGPTMNKLLLKVNCNDFN